MPRPSPHVIRDQANSSVFPISHGYRKGMLAPLPAIFLYWKRPSLSLDARTPCLTQLRWGGHLVLKLTPQSCARSGWRFSDAHSPDNEVPILYMFSSSRGDSHQTWACSHRQAFHISSSLPETPMPAAVASSTGVFPQRPLQIPELLATSFYRTRSPE